MNPGHHRDLPSGEVTFLLTDIHGSTALWERAPHAMTSALTRHDELARRAVDRCGGVLLKAKGEGDATFSVFGSAADATRAAVELQRAVAAEAWPPDAQIRVRIAVHTGPAELRDNDYFGPTVNRAARLRGAAHGGQTLVSSATASLVGASLPSGVALRDLGLRRLRDLREPEHIFQLDAEGLPNRFPPLAALDARPNNLPVQITSFVGRDDILAHVVGLFRAKTRLVTLTGPGGIGKTRLALQTAAELIDDFPDGVWLVELASIGDVDAVLSAISTTIGVVPEPGQSPLEALRADVASHRRLLVLDNFEHVLDAAPLVSDLLAAGEGLAVLATSRDWLHLRGEHEVRVDVLSPAAAHALFIDRARAVQRDIDASELAAVDRICLGLDCLPLAIELVAARLREYELSDLVEQLRDVLDVAVDGHRDLPMRQRTLRDTLAWSVGLLESHERVAYERLSVFRGVFSVEAGAAVIGVEPADAVPVFSSLVSKSLLSEPATGRFSMLETVKAHAAEALAADANNHELAVDAHLQWHAARALAWFDEQGGLSVELFDDIYRKGNLGPDEAAMLDDIRTACTRAAFGSSPAAALACWLASMLRAPDPVEALLHVENAGTPDDPEWRYWLSFAQITLCWHQERWADVLALARQLLQGARDRGSASLREIYNFEGIAHWRLGAAADAERALKLAIAATDRDDAEGLALLEQNLGLVCMSRGDYAAAEAHISRALDLLPGDGDLSLVLELVLPVRLAWIDAARGRWAQAVRVAMPFVDDAPIWPAVLALDVVVLGQIGLGQVDEALEAVERLAARVANAASAGELSVPFAPVWIANARGAAKLAAGDIDRARDAFEEVARTATFPREQRAAKLGLASVARRSGHLAEARALLVHAIDGSELEAERSILSLAEVEWALGERRVAWARSLGLAHDAEKAGHAPVLSRACRALADFAVDDGDHALAARLLGAADGAEQRVGIERLPPDSPGRRADEVIGTLDPVRIAARSEPVDDVLAAAGVAAIVDRDVAD